MTFEEFVKSQERNVWTEDGTLRLYLRRTPQGWEHKWGNFQLASMENSYRGNGDLKRFLDKYEKKYQFYIENILNPRLYHFFVNRNYTVTNKMEVLIYGAAQCMMSPNPHID